VVECDFGFAQGTDNPVIEYVHRVHIERSRNKVEMKSKPPIKNSNMKGYMYILLCSNGQYYTGSTKNLERRLAEHQNGEGANFTKKHLPVELVYYEEFQRVDKAFYREKQVQGWSRQKKEALINGETNKLHDLSECKNETHFRNVPFGSAQGTTSRTSSEVEMQRVETTIDKLLMN